MLDIFSIDELETIRVVVFVLFTVSAIGVIFGVYWENENNERPLRHCGWKLLVCSLGIEVVLTIGVFVVDGTISSRQRTTIEQLLAYRHLSAEQKERLIAVTKKFPSLDFLVFTVPENEPWGLGIEIGKLLRENGWNWIDCDGPFKKMRSAYADIPSFCQTILSGIQLEGAENRKGAMEALEAAFRDLDVIGMENVRWEQNAAFPTIAIMVGSKR